MTFPPTRLTRLRNLLDRHVGSGDTICRMGSMTEPVVARAR